eukprot:TRINITY_DN8513_c0_g1_i1.p1 TRINITY_DN8513_c0_g1~~TRINITY_DN8513_c0_g1_i1.p1  ORF type:complete len:564 (+),score=126.97 TRINITY_DN8513_c0_g1_i1:170-1693(+)
MPSLRNIMMDGGVRFTNGVVQTTICCPSRTETFSGRMYHNIGPPNEPGSCMHVNTTNVVTPGRGMFPLLQAAGYKTGVFGKVTNDQSKILNLAIQLQTMGYIDSPIDYNNFEGLTYQRRFDNGTNYVEKLDKNNPIFSTPYQTTQIGNRTLRWLDQVLSSEDNAPFLAYIGPHAPHFPAEPAPWYQHLWDNVSAPVTPNYNLSSPDKPQHIRQNPPLSADVKCWEDQHFRDRWSSLKSVDELLQDVYDNIDAAGQLDRTVFIYSSDHGYKLGQWRVGTSKQHPYETDIHVPFLVRGPQIMQGAEVPNLVANIDILPTMLELAGAEVPDFIDGKSFLPLILNQDSPLQSEQLKQRAAQWRDHFMVEYYSVGTYYNDHSGIWSDDTNTKTCGSKPPRSPPQFANISKCKEANETGAGECYFIDSTHSNSWRLLRIMTEEENLAYIEYDPKWKFEATSPVGEGLQFYELYNVTADPYQVDNIYDRVRDELKQELHQKLAAYWICSGASCP